MKFRQQISWLGPISPVLIYFLLTSIYFAFEIFSRSSLDQPGQFSLNLELWELIVLAVLAVVSLFLSTMLTIKLNSDRERALNAFQVSQMRLQAVFDNTPVCLNLKDTEGRYLLVNKPYEDWLGHSAEEIIGKKASEFLTSETEVENLSAAEKTTLETGEVFEREVSVERENGKIYHRILIKYPIADAGGSIAAVGTVAVDVTARKEIEDELKELNEELENRVQEGIGAVRYSEDRFRHAFENAPVGVALITPEGNRFQVNQALADFLGYSVGELTNTTMKSTAGNTGDLDKSMILRQRVLDGEIDTYRNERRYQHQDGRIIWGEVTGALYRNPAGEPEHFIAHTIDITERKHAEAALRENEAQMRLITDTIPELITYVDADLRYRFVNQKAIEWFGKPREEILGKHVEELLGPQEMAVLRNRIEKVMAGERVTYEKEICFPDGITRQIEDNLVPNISEEGSVNGYFNFVADIGDRKLAEEQLRQAQKMEAVGQLTGGVAHDFNNLLLVIQGNAEMLAAESGSNSALADPILRATDRGTELTQRLLAFSRQQPLQPKAIDVKDLVMQMPELLTRTLVETIEIETRVEPNCWQAMADPGQVETALLNLALNARDAMPDGGCLTFECSNIHLNQEDATDNMDGLSGDFIVLAVSDTGHGMSPEICEHVFEPFYTTKEVGEGSGLGLSMVYGFAKQSGGHAVVNSEEGLGTTVRLYLPRAKNAPTSPIVNRNEDYPRGRGETVLVIEDDPDVRSLTVSMLESMNYQIFDVADAAAADSVLAAGPMPAVVLSDVVLRGGMNGPEFADMARTTHPDLKFIFMSGYPAEAVKRNSIVESDWVLLNKPFQRKQLAKVLRETLDGAN